MSVGVRIGIRASYTDEAQALAEHYLRAINVALRENGLSEYHEPLTVPNVYQEYHFGRSALDHNGASAFGEMAKRLQKGRPHVGLVMMNRVAYVPIDFPHPFRTLFQEKPGWFGSPKLWVGSAQRLLAELLEGAGKLEIHLKNGRLEDEEAQRINELVEQPDNCQEDSLREAWLLMHEGARLAVEHGVAMSLAG